MRRRGRAGLNVYKECQNSEPLTPFRKKCQFEGSRIYFMEFEKEKKRRQGEGREKKRK